MEQKGSGCVWRLLAELGGGGWVWEVRESRTDPAGLEGKLRGGDFVLGALGSHRRSVSWGGAASARGVGRLLPGLVGACGGREAGEEARQGSSGERRGHTESRAGGMG